MPEGFISYSLTVCQGILLLALAPGFAGLLNYCKASLQRRRRHPWKAFRQPYRDLFKLFKKPAVRPKTASWLFAITPAVLFAAYGLLAFLIPVFHPTPLVPADLILVIYLLGLARFVLSLAGLDAGAPFGGLGGSREMFLHVLTETGLILVLAALALRWGTVRLDDLFILHQGLQISLYTQPDLLLLGLALAILILFETARIPIDNPATHLELTMAQKAITLEFAGRDLALIEWAEWIKLAFFLTLFGNLFLPLPELVNMAGLSANVLALGIYLLKITLLVLLLALWEMHRPKLRLRKVVGPALFSMALSLTAIIYIVSIPGR